MKIEEVERLLARFYEGNTSRQEELQLREALSRDDLPEHLQPDKRLFQSLYSSYEASGQEVPGHLENNLRLLIDQWDKEENKKAMAPGKPRLVRPTNIRRFLYWAGSTAAVIALVASLYFSLPDVRPSLCPIPDKDTFDDPQAAGKALQTALSEVSMCLNEGIRQVEETQDDFTAVYLELEKELKNK